MANRTVKDAQTIHGTNPQYLVEKIIRGRIYDSKYWKEQCFALTAELLVDKAMELRSLGGVYGGNIQVTPFLCLTLKMLQIQPEKDIIIEFIKQDDFKYVRALGAFYLRLVHSSLDCYNYLEPLLNDYRKLRFMNRDGKYELTHMDEFVDNLLREDRVNDIQLPRIQKRWHHENSNQLEARISLLDDDLDLESESEEDDLPPSPPPTPPHRRGENDHRSGREDRLRGRSSPNRNGMRSNRDRDKRHRSRSRDRVGRDDPERKRRRSRSRERRRRSPGNDPRFHHKHRERPRERGKERGERERERDREREHRLRKDQERGRHKEKKREKDHDREKKRHRRERESSLDLEIAEANALRAKLGMKPLRK